MTCQFITLKNIYLNPDKLSTQVLFFTFLSIVIFYSLSYIYFWAIKKNLNRIKIVVIIFILLIQGLTVAARINVRFNNPRIDTLPHDGIAQTEVAMNLLMQGKNPYEENYHETAMDNFRDHYITMGGAGKVWRFINPALESYVYMPLSFILPLPLKIMFTNIFGFYDNRIFNFIIYLLACFFIYKIPKTQKKKNCALIFFTLNNFFYLHMVFGFNDILPLLFLLSSYYYLKKEQYSKSIIMISIAGLSKQNIIFFWPFFLAYILFKKFWPLNQRSFLQYLKYPLIMLLLCCVILLPFILWNPGAFYYDTVTYLKYIYPARGVGLAGLLLNLHIISDPLKYYGFVLWQVTFIIIFLPLLLYKQFKKNNPQHVYLYGTILMTGMWFFSRNFTEAHLGVVITNLIIAMFL
ncbi:MAG: hypothetical protein WC687_03830 [Patescibacteria group bacterium]